MFLFLLFTNLLFSQIYFPDDTQSWERVSPQSLGWCAENEDELNTFLDTTHTRAFVILKNGKIAFEQYYNGFKKDSLWYWASAAKSLTSVLVGIAEQENMLNINDKSSKYLGEAWTSLPKEKEDLITIYHQLTMTTGLDEKTNPNESKAPEFLTYKADAGTRWFYYNVPYLLLHNVLEAAYGQTMNNITNQKIKSKIGMKGLWFDNLFISTALDAARFGLLIMNNGVWKNDTILNPNSEYSTNMINSSQQLNPAYGYLWWLNGKSQYIQPGLGIKFNGWIIPSASSNLFMAAGKNDQRIYIDKERELVIVRFGEPGDEVALAVSGYDEELWEKVNKFICFSNNVENLPTSYHFENNILHFDRNLRYRVFDLSGNLLSASNSNQVNLNIYSGYLFVSIDDNHTSKTFKLFISK